MRFQTPICLPFDKLRMDGSMVLYFFNVGYFSPCGAR